LRLEQEAERAEDELNDEIGEAEADLAEVTVALREVRQLLEVEAARGTAEVGEVLSAMKGLKPPSVPLTAHLSRTMEARADALRARMWLVTAMRDDLKRLGTELGQAVKLVDEGRRALQRAEQQRVAPRPRLERLKSHVEESLNVNAIHDSPAPRRKAPRLRLDAAIDLHSQSNFYTGFTENISNGGIFIATTQKIPIDTEVDIAFTLPTGFEIRGRGRVRWSREETPHTSGGVGVQFDDLSREAKAAIESFLEAREPIFHPDDDE
jgi:uncharacterized protein (TIGR02266 family)